MVRHGLLGLAAMALALVLACGDDTLSSLTQPDLPIALQGSGKRLDLGLCTSPDPGDFTIDSTNPYFPIEAGLQWDYEGLEDGVPVRLLITVLNDTRVVDGVTTRVLEEREWVDDELLEVSWNYYVNAPDGTTCYFGEDVDIFEEGGIVHDGAWCAEDDPDVNRPGIIMPADPQPGMEYLNEDAPGIAQDLAKIVGFVGSVTVPAGTFTEAIRVEESNPFDKGKGYKIFSAGTGLIIDGPFELTSSVQGARAPRGPIPTDQSCGL